MTMKKAKRKRDIQLWVWLNEKESAELNRKAAMAKLPKSTVIRMLLINYELREAPDERFYEAMRQFYAMNNNLNQLTRKANTLGFADASPCRAYKKVGAVSTGDRADVSAAGEKQS